MSDLSANRVLSVTLCRFCGKRASVSAPYIAACRCLGPNASLHKHCLEDWLSRNKKTQCDVCRYHYRLDYSQRSFGEWYEAESDKGRSLQFKQLLFRVTQVVALFIVSYKLTGDLTEGLWVWRGARARFVLAWLTMLWASFRFVSVHRTLAQYFVHSWDEFVTWRDDNLKVTVHPNPNNCANQAHN